MGKTVLKIILIGFLCFADTSDIKWSKISKTVPYPVSPSPVSVSLINYVSTLSMREHKERNVAERYKAEKKKISYIKFWLTGKRELPNKIPEKTTTKKRTVYTVNVKNKTVVLTAMSLREKRIKKRGAEGLVRFEQIRRFALKKDCKFFFYPRNFTGSTDERYTNVVMKFDTPIFYYIFSSGLMKLAKLFIKYNYELRICGGAVRDLLNGTIPDDIDFATNASPEQMNDMLNENHFTVIHTKVQCHGIFTTVVDTQKFEITSLRREVSEDGEISNITFIGDWAEDASRRDLTVNAMFLGLDGLVYDYYNGCEDLKKGRVIFVGDPDKRIQEDYLRILRYFRFFGKITHNPRSYDSKTLKAIQKNAPGLGKVFGKRVWKELQKIITGNHAKQIVKKMMEMGITNYIGLNSSVRLDIESFEYMYELRDKYDFHYRAVTYIGALLNTEEQVEAFNSRILLPEADLDLLKFLVEYKSTKMCTKQKVINRNVRRRKRIR